MKTTLHTYYHGNLILKDGEPQMSRFAGGYASFDADTIDGYAFDLRPIPLDRFYARDPLAEKYYSISPYAYCAGDPVNLVDPDGESTYKITTSWQNGQQSVSIDCTETDDDFDMVYVDDEKKGQKLEDQSIMKGLMNNRRRVMYSNNIVMSTSSKNGEDIMNLFFYLADNSNVEWAASKYSDGTYGLGAYEKYSTTNVNIKGAAPGRFDEIQTVDKEEAHIHSHPQGTRPSDQDYQAITANRNAIRDVPGNDKIPTYSETSTQYLYLKKSNIIAKYYYYTKNKFHENRGLGPYVSKESFVLKR